MSDDTEFIELERKYREKYEGDDAHVTETIKISPLSAKDIIKNLAFQSDGKPSKAKWEEVKKRADHVEIDRTVYDK